MPDIHVEVRGKKARQTCDTLYVCGNGDYKIILDLDEEWDEYDAKTAVFRYRGKDEPVVFTGLECPVPKIYDIYSFEFGIYAGDLHVTTPADVFALPGILDRKGPPPDPKPDVYHQIMNLLNRLLGGNITISDDGEGNLQVVTTAGDLVIIDDGKGNRRKLQKKQ